jgi:hypothetical protein
LGGATKTNKKKAIAKGDIAPGLGGATKTNKKKAKVDGDIAPGLGGANKKLTRKKTIDEGDIPSGFVLPLSTLELYLLQL